MKVILQYRRPLIPELIKLPFANRSAHLPEELHKEVEVMHGVQPHREDLFAHI